MSTCYKITDQEAQSFRLYPTINPKMMVFEDVNKNHDHLYKSKSLFMLLNEVFKRMRFRLKLIFIKKKMITETYLF